MPPAAGQHSSSTYSQQDRRQQQQQQQQSVASSAPPAHAASGLAAAKAANRAPGDSVSASTTAASSAAASHVNSTLTSPLASSRSLSPDQSEGSSISGTPPSSLSAHSLATAARHTQGQSGRGIAVGKGGEGHGAALPPHATHNHGASLQQPLLDAAAGVMGGVARQGAGGGGGGGGGLGGMGGGGRGGVGSSAASDGARTPRFRWQKLRVKGRQRIVLAVVSFISLLTAVFAFLIWYGFGDNPIDPTLMAQSPRCYQEEDWPSTDCCSSLLLTIPHIPSHSIPFIPSHRHPHQMHADFFAVATLLSGGGLAFYRLLLFSPPYNPSHPIPLNSFHSLPPPTPPDACGLLCSRHAAIRRRIGLLQTAALLSSLQSLTSHPTQFLSFPPGSPSHPHPHQMHADFFAVATLLSGGGLAFYGLLLFSKMSVLRAGPSAADLSKVGGDFSEVRGASCEARLPRCSATQCVSGGGLALYGLLLFSKMSVLRAGPSAADLSKHLLGGGLALYGLLLFSKMSVLRAGPSAADLSKVGAGRAADLSNVSAADFRKMPVIVA
ncbi:unnamed protein product [Closterium sp. Yama58-4]|nr:unnamed protein product [Closterium sp. Yama58-4]